MENRHQRDMVCKYTTHESLVETMSSHPPLLNGDTVGKVKMLELVCYMNEPSAMALLAGT